MPFIARWPGMISAGTVCNEFLAMLEFFPTALSLAGVAPPKNVILDGFNMMPVLKREAPSRRNAMFWWSISGPRAVRLGHRKWVREKDEEGLYDLSADIGETNNLRDQHPEKYRELRAAWDVWWKEMEASEPRGPYRNY
jgi:arylsulfatase A-like enzyme